MDAWLSLLHISVPVLVAMSTLKTLHKRLLTLLSQSTPATLLVVSLCLAAIAGAGAYVLVALLRMLSLALGLQWDGGSAASSAMASVSSGLREAADSLHRWGIGSVLLAYARGEARIEGDVGTAHGPADNLGGVPYIDDINPFPIDVVYTSVQM